MYTFKRSDQQPRAERKPRDNRKSADVSQEITDQFVRLQAPLIKKLTTIARDRYKANLQEYDRFEFSISDFVMQNKVETRQQVGVARRLAQWLSTNTHHTICEFTTPEKTYLVKLEIGAHAPKVGSLGSVIVQYRFV